jgi:hypothetical protein
LSQTTLQRNPRNALEQLGQIEEASFLDIAGLRRPGIRIAVSSAIGVVTVLDEFPVEFALELIPVF